MSRQAPRLMLGPLSGRIYIVTRYKVIDADRGTFEALEKHDVTDQFMAVKEQAEASFNYTPIDKPAVVGGVVGCERQRKETP